MSSLRLQNKIAIITGAGSGIGAATAKLFVQEGAQVVMAVHNKNAPSTQKTIAEIIAIGGENSVFVHEIEITDKNSVLATVQASLSAFGRIDILINNAGVNVKYDPVLLPDTEWQRCFDLNLNGAWYCIQACLPSMLAQQYGHIVNIASVHAHKIIPNAFPYPVAKHGLIGLTKSIGVQYAAQGIRANSISPGLIMTEMVQRYFASLPNPKEAEEQQLQFLPNKRIGEPIEVAHTALFLASDEARFINATDIIIDGGRCQIYVDSE